ncbi:LCP family protein [bacterium]|nr:LCP family protein [bacterium]
MDFKKRKINLLDNSPEQDMPDQPVFKEKKPRLKRTESKPSQQISGKRKRFSCFFIILIIALTIISNMVSADNNSFLSGVKNSYLIRQITHIISNKEKHMAGEKEDRINFVLLGMGGAGHAGPYLTDTIIIASFKPSTKEAAIFSLPRDMIVPLNRGDYRKINSIYTIGELQDDRGGGQLMKDIISETFDIPIHYFAAVDFNGFIEMIDAIGGIKVDVKRSFIDYEFPTYDDKWQTVSFEAGEQKMDGITALRFSRSRHGNNGEGSDFARIKRQQTVLLAAKDKMTSFNTLINPKKITSLFSLFNKYTKTDLEPWEAVKLVHLAKGMNTQQVVTQSIDDRPGGYLKSGIAIDGAYILQPTTGNYNQINLLINNIFELKKVSSENAKIIIQNGTDVPGLALKAVNYLSQMGYNIIRYGNAQSQEKISTIIYDYTNNKSQTAKSLEAVFQSKVENDIPNEFANSVITSNWGIRNEDGDLEQLDFLIILGQDQILDDSIEIVTTIDPSLLNSSTPTSTEDVLER